MYDNMIGEMGENLRYVRKGLTLISFAFASALLEE
jgi:hypothetical protein